ncbi:MAG: type II toxin-antitoxin system Phd/YefM family antitoxin [Spirochaetaceae bacterium]
MHTWSLQNAKARFSELVKVCMEDGPQMVTRHGRDTVVVISAQEYRRSIAQPTNLKDFLLSAPRVDLSIERPKDTGREVNL